MTNKSDYNIFCNQHELPIFYQPWWLDVVSKNWDVVVYKKSNQIFGNEKQNERKRTLRKINIFIHSGYLFSIFWQIPSKIDLISILS